MSLVYVYAIAHADGAPPADLRGMDDGVVRAERAGDLAAFVSDVPEAEFAEVPLNANLSNMEWLAPRAIRHQEVNAGLAATVDPLVPLSFGTVFRDRASVERMLRERAEEVGPRLEALRGKAEWIAVVRRDLGTALAALESASEPLRALRAQIDAAAPGRGYLVTRRLDETKRQELRASDAGALGAATAALERAGGLLYREPLVADAGGGVLARFSVLAGRQACPELARAGIGEWLDRGYVLEITGPWPAYRFATVNGS